MEDNIVYKSWLKSKIIITQIISTISGAFGLYGQDALDSLNGQLDFIKTNVNPKYFILISIGCAIATGYFRLKAKTLVVLETKKQAEVRKEGE